MITADKLEEKVREILKDPREISVTRIIYVKPDEVSFCNNWHQYWVTADKVVYSLPCGGGAEKTIPEYTADYGNYRKEVKAIAALLTPPEPTTESLLGEIEKLKESCEFANKRNDELREKVAQQREDYINSSSVYEQKIEALRDQLDNSVSEADHEREMQDWQSAFETVTKERDEARKEAERFKQAFFREYFNRQPVLDLSKEDSYP